MKCPKCGAENPDNTNFCTNCGNSLSVAEPKKETKKLPFFLHNWFMSLVFWGSMGFLFLVVLILFIIRMVKYPEHRKNALICLGVQAGALILIGAIGAYYGGADDRAINKYLKNSDYAGAIEYIENNIDYGSESYYEKRAYVYGEQKDYDAATNEIVTYIENKDDLTKVYSGTIDLLDKYSANASSESKTKAETAKASVTKAKEDAAAKAKAEKEAKEKAEAEAKAKAEAEAKEKAEAEAREKEEAEAKKQAEKEAKEKEKQEAEAKKKAEKEAKEKEEAEAKAKAEAEAKAKEQAENDKKTYGITRDEFAEVLFSYGDPGDTTDADIDEWFEEWKSDPQHWGWVKNASGKWTIPLSESEIQAQAVNFTYKDLMRYPDQYEGIYVAKKFYLRGKVEGTNNKYGAYTVGEYNLPDYDSDFIIIDNRTDKSMKLLEGDIGIIYGVFKGINSTDYYQSNALTDKKVYIEIPEIDMMYFELIEE
ncbi:MAG: zinc ribbon domain-containing protein [Butyrivibrio sp.]|nr:zinc ribbon domain-containing protein [Butyrivibrio sp.]